MYILDNILQLNQVLSQEDLKEIKKCGFYLKKPLLLSHLYFADAAPRQGLIYIS